MHKTNCMQSIENISTWEVFSSICPWNDHKHMRLVMNVSQNENSSKIARPAREMGNTAHFCGYLFLNKMWFTWLILPSGLKLSHFQSGHCNVKKSGSSALWIIILLKNEARTPYSAAYKQQHRHKQTGAIIISLYWRYVYLCSKYYFSRHFIVSLCSWAD